VPMSVTASGVKPVFNSARPNGAVIFDTDGRPNTLSIH
jgi:hypothetical protein